MIVPIDEFGEIDIYAETVEPERGPMWVRGPSPEEVAADIAQALLDESIEDVEKLFDAQDKKAISKDAFDSIVEQIAHLSSVKGVAWKQASAAQNRPRSAGMLDFISDVGLAAKRVCSAYQYTYFMNCFVHRIWPESICPPATLKAIRTLCGAEFRRRKLQSYFQYSPPKAKR